MKAFPSACNSIHQYPAGHCTVHTLLKSPVSPNIRLRGDLSAVQILWWAFTQGVSFILPSEHCANKQADPRPKEMIDSISLAVVQSHLWKTYQMHRLMLLCGFYCVGHQKYPTWAEYLQLNSFHLEGLLGWEFGCPLNYKSQPAAFCNRNPYITFSRESQMATMWEGYCAFDAICIVITPVKKCHIPSVMHHPLMSHP